MLCSTTAFAGENGRTVGDAIVGIDGMSYFDLPPPGIYLLNYSGVSDSRRFADNFGNDALPGGKLTTFYNVARISLLADVDILGADLAAFEIFPTYVQTRFTYNNQTYEKSGLSDFGVDPFGLAWTTENSKIGFSTTFTIPTGSYNPYSPVNIGTNHATWIPQFFYTRFSDDRSSDISVHLMYEHPFSNKEGLVNQINPTGAEYESGDVFHAAVAYRKDVMENLSFGVQAVGAVQLEDDRIIGAAASNDFLQGPLDGNRYEKLAIGLSVRYLVAGRMPVTLTYQRDVYARNTIQGDSLMLRVGIPFKIF